MSSAAGRAVRRAAGSDLDVACGARRPGGVDGVDEAAQGPGHAEPRHTHPGEQLVQGRVDDDSPDGALALAPPWCGTQPRVNAGPREHELDAACLRRRRRVLEDHMHAWPVFDVA